MQPRHGDPLGGGISRRTWIQASLAAAGYTLTRSVSEGTSARGADGGNLHKRSCVRGSVTDFKIRRLSHPPNAIVMATRTPPRTTMAIPMRHG